MKKLLLSSLISYSVLLGFSKKPFDSGRFFDALAKIETGGSKDPDNEIGDNGRALGRYQIHKVYWKDAIDYDKSIKGTYDDVRKSPYARLVITAYFERYASKYMNDGDVEKLARIHNGGPNGHNKKSTESYGKKFMEIYK